MFNSASDGVLHNRPLPENHVKVSIVEVVKGEEGAPLPVPLELIDVHTVGDAVGTFVAWLNTLVIVVDLSSPTQSQGGKKRHTGLSRGSAVQPKLLLPSPNIENARYNDLLLDPLPTELYFLGKYMKKMSSTEQIEVDFEKEILNMRKPITEYIGREEICQLLLQEQLSATHISTYIKFLWVHYLVHVGKARYFSFLNPHSIAALAGNDDKKQVEQKQYIADALIERSERDTLFLAPYNAGSHWLLIVIKPYTETIYYLDPLHSDPELRLHMQELFNQALLMFCANKRNQIMKSKASTPKWVKVQCPRQTNNVDCGYYVIRFMKEIVSHTDSSIPEKYFPDCRCLQYSKAQIDEVRSDWAQYIHKCA